MSSGAQANLTLALESLLQTDWTADHYQSYYDTSYCLNQNVSYSHRVDAEGEASSHVGPARWVALPASLLPLPVPRC
jgi:hypothetical protein